MSQYGIPGRCLCCMSPDVTSSGYCIDCGSFTWCSWCKQRFCMHCNPQGFSNHDCPAVPYKVKADPLRPGGLLITGRDPDTDCSTHPEDEPVITVDTIDRSGYTGPVRIISGSGVTHIPAHTITS
mgnify:CR=1 FL=1